MSGHRPRSWTLPPTKLTLGADDVHVWRTTLHVPEPDIVQFHATLSPDERERADRYRFLRDQRRFIVARGWLRAILGTYLSLDASKIRFCYNPHGKPELDMAQEGTPSLHDPLQFNMAHSEDLAILAVSRERRVGIDVEQIRSGFGDGTIAESFFTPCEVAALRALPRLERENAFFACWTRKEAYLKARGEGLIMPLDTFEVSLLPGDDPALLRTSADPAETARWTLCELDVGPGYSASLAVEGQGWRLSLWQEPAFLQSPIGLD
jgi:4'-phosphopantetheinyl transferase